MAWKEIPGNPYWYWNDNPPADKLPNVDGVRTRGLSQIFSQVRRVEDPEDADRGEISATYWNAKVGVLGIQDAAYYASLPTVGGPTIDNLFIPVGSDALITSDGNFFLVAD
jgi:hypothetical protein